MYSPWSAREDEDPATWDKAHHESRILWHRLYVWRTFPILYSHCLAWLEKQQVQCRFSGKTHPGMVRRTPLGPMCLSCWLDWPSCDECGVGAKEPGYDGKTTFRGRNLCADCLVPDVSEGYIRWSLECMLSLGSSFAYVVDDIPPLTTRLTGRL